MSKLFTDNDGNWDWKKIGYRARSAFAVVLSLSILLGGGYVVYKVGYDKYIEWRTAEDYIGEGKDKVEVTIPAGVSLTNIGEILIDAKVVRSMKAFRAAVDAEPKSKGIQAGKYNLLTELPAKSAVAMLLDPKTRVVNRVTIIEGLRQERQWAALAKPTGITAEQFAEEAKKGSEYGLPAWAGGKPEGLLFPDTYELSDKPTAKEIFSKQLAQFNTVAKSINFEGRAEELKLTPMQLLTIASLVQGETGDPKYMPMVARVVYNRLQQNMPLQFDSTVHYAVNKYDTVFTTPEQRQIDSPYNTYLEKNAGKLPPGPINSPGKAALQAASAPADSKALFFVTINLDTGETLFAETYTEQQANEAKLQEFCKTSDKC